MLRMVSSGNTTSSYYCTAYSPVVPISKMKGTVRVSFWMKVADISAWDSKYPLQLRFQDSACTNLCYIEPTLTNLYSNKPTVKNGEWVQYVYERDWEGIKSGMIYSGSYTFDDAAYFCIRLSLPRNGDVTFKRPCVELI